MLQLDKSKDPIQNPDIITEKVRPQISNQRIRTITQEGETTFLQLVKHLICHRNLIRTS